ncbi:neo-calmodulin-like [Convolutriloba macropyga]|uniref:neo-calmodulin-like n=1 Tax=Convolutriloba macropyga TaxID=536237 RepID=UPI003F522832
MSSKLTQIELEEYREVFNDFDQDGSGAVSTQELKLMFRSLGQEISDQELKELVDEVDKDGNGEVDFEEFCEMMAKKIAEQGDVDIERDLQDVFKLFDKNNRGYITFDDLKKCLKMLSIKLPEDKIQNMITEASTAGDDRVYFDDFRYMYFC